MLAADERWQAHEARRAANMAAREAAIRRGTEEQAKFSAEVEAWTAAVAEAAVAGRGAPKRPDPPDSEVGILTMRAIEAEWQQIREAETLLLADLAAEMIDGLRERAAARAEEAQPAMRTLLDVLSATQEDAGLAQRLRRAVETTATEVERPSPADRTMTRFTVDDIVLAVRYGKDLLEPTRTPLEESRIMRDDPRLVFAAQEDPNGAPLGLKVTSGWPTVAGWPGQPAAQPGNRGVNI
jgi:hypothetical protein